MKKLLISTVGLPRSGKSTWCRKMSKNYPWPVVNPDSVRLSVHGQRYASEAEPMVWFVVRVMISSLFKAGHDVVLLDATGNSRKRRDSMSSPDWECQYKVIGTTEEECIRRAKVTNDEEIITVIESMVANREDLHTDEMLFPPFPDTPVEIKIDSARAEGAHVLADGLQFDDSGRCKLCDELQGGDRDHRCWSGNAFTKQEE